MLKLKDHLETFEHVIWDWNGTLLADLDHAINSVNPLLKEHGLSLVDVSTYKKVFGFPIKNYYSKLGFDFSKESFESLGKRFIHNFNTGVHNCGLISGAEKLLSHLKAKGKILSVLSASEQSALNAQVKLFGLEAVFEHVHGIDNIYAASKLQRGRELLSKVNVRSEKTVLVGDTDHDLEVGKELGIQVILVPHGHQDKDYLKGLHPHVVDVFDEA